MTVLERGRYRVREAEGPRDVDAALGLRAIVFPADRDGGDAFDATCRHVLVEKRRGGDIVATFRILTLSTGAEIARSYSARHYDLAPLAGFADPMLELGRFCLRPGARDPDILRLAWGGLARIVDAGGIEFLFGCASFPGTEPRNHAEAFALLGDRHQAPPRWRPGRIAPHTVALTGRGPADPAAGMARMPPLLRTYLTMGGWVSDHAVIDPEMDTIHVFTGVEVSAIPATRQKLLRSVSG